VIVDESKLVPRLGSKAPVPVEVHPFGWRFAAESLVTLGATVEVRQREGEMFRTDNGNHILDARFRSLAGPTRLAARIMAIPGVVGHGLFLGMTETVYVGTEEGVRTLKAARKPTRKS